MKALGLGIMIIFLLLASLLLMLVMSKVKEARKYRNQTMLYFLLAAFCFGIAALTGLTGLSERPVIFFLVLQFFAVVIGALHARFLYRLLPWSSVDKFLWEFLFTVGIASLGTIFLLVVFRFILKLQELQYIYLSVLALFFVPFFFVHSLHRYLTIPPKIFKAWKYPLGKEIPDPLDSELVSLLVISFIFRKKTGDAEVTTFRAKAPQHMVFSRLFYYFINDYNERHPESTIEFTDGDKGPCGWVFYLKPGWLGQRKYIDPDQVIIDNRIRENSVIVCQRIKED
jgi:hypothetical protein